ncbi:MAG: nuclear transport factor 2 family protein [Actinomycetota bacterium]
MAHPNEDLLRRGYEAFSKADMPAVQEFFAEDLVWHVPGRSQISGDYRGAQEVLGFLGRTMEMTGGTFGLEVHDLLADDEHGVALVLARAQREGKSLEDRQVHVMHLQGGKVVEFWAHPGDQHAVDEFWS